MRRNHLPWIFLALAVILGASLPAAAQARLNLISPNGAESWRRGLGYPILWTREDTTANVKIDLYKDGALYSTLSASTANSGIFLWQIPADHVRASNYRVKIALATNPTVSDESEADFTISAATTNVVWTTGFDGSGQLGQGGIQNPDPDEFVQIPGTDDIVAISAGLEHSLAVTGGGLVRGTGCNSSGELGLNHLLNRNQFTQALNLTNIVAVAAGHGFSLALESDGTVWSTGQNTYGQLGLGHNNSVNTFQQVGGLTGIVAIAAGGNYSMALKNDGTLYAAGNNNFGQLGLPDITTTNVFTLVEKDVDGNDFNLIVAIAAGQEHSLVAKRDGSLWVSGGNAEYHQCGWRPAVDLAEFKYIGQGATTPVQGVELIAAGRAHSLLRENSTDGSGTVKVVGRNDFGQLGLDGTVDRDRFQSVLNMPDIVDISAGANHSMTLKRDRTFWVAGSNQFGELGIGNTNDIDEFTQILNPRGFVSIKAGNGFTVAIINDVDNGLKGDFAGASGAPSDGYVDIHDLNAFSAHWQTQQGGGNWDDRYDIAGPGFGDPDGVVDIWDLTLLADNWHTGNAP